MGRFKDWVGKRSAAARAMGSRRLHIVRPAGSPPIELAAAALTWCASVLAACRRALPGVPSLPRGVGRHLPSRAGRRPAPSLHRLRTFFSRSGSSLRRAALQFKASAGPRLTQLGEAKPEDGARRIKKSLGRGTRGRRLVVLGVATVAVVLASGLGLTAANAAWTDPPFVVNNTDDRVDAAINGTCAAAVSVADKCTLRAAIQEANARPGGDIIYILPGTYAIGIAPINENAANVGDFEILDPVRIEKAAGHLGAVVIDGGTPLQSSPLIARGLDRLFEIHPGAGDVTFRNVTLQNGFHAEEGGAIQNWSLGKLTLDGVTVKDSYASEAGGGLNNADLHDYAWTTEPPNLDLLPFGRVEIKGSTFTGNGAGGGSGGAINNVSGGTITISDQSVITLNPGAIMNDPLDPEEKVLVDPSDYPIAASAIANQARWEGAGTIKISNSTVSLNAAEGNGGGIFNEGDSVVELTNTTLSENYATSGGGGLYTTGGKVSVVGGTVTKNEAANGGGLYSGGHVSQFGLRGRFDVKGSQITENTAENGGGLFNDGDAQLSVSDTTFTKNHSSDHGAAVSSEGRSSMTLTRVTVHDNESWGEGGGVWAHSERLQTIVDSVFTANDAGVPHIEDGMLTDDVAGGGGLYTDGGPVTVLRTKFDGNTATEEGGGMSLHNLGDILVADSELTNNRAHEGGGTENSGTRVTFERLLVAGNRAGGYGGGIYNTSSGEFYIVDSTIRGNSAVAGGGIANAPDNHFIMRGSLIMNNTARLAPMEEGELDVDENAGRGGGVISIADGQSKYENSTFSGNKAAVAGGGLFHDADGELRLTHMTIWRNAAPIGGGVGVVESDFSPPIPPKTNAAVIAKNSIIGGSIEGGNCDWFIRSEGGNLETGPKHTCFLAVTSETAQSPVELGVHDRMGDPDLWALADNGGPTLTHALQYGSLAIDSSEQPCSVVDQRGVERPQNDFCDAGAYEFVGPPPPFDNTPPQTIFVPGPNAGGPVQDSVETMAWKFSGTDNLTAPEELNFECRLIEQDLVEQPDIVAPWDPVPPELAWNGCSSPWTTVLFEEGLLEFQVRAIDRAGNVDPTPVSYLFDGLGMPPPQTVIAEAPGLPSGTQISDQNPQTTTPSTNSRSALFSFMAISEFTPSQFAEYECRLDSRDPAMWLECTNPAMYSNLTTGLHTFEVRAWAGEASGPDPTPARYTWRVGTDPDGGSAPISCDEANLTLTPSADGWADQVNPLENYWTMTELNVRSAATVAPTGTTPENARAFFRFNLTSDAPACALESATLRLYSSSHTEGRTLEAVPLSETWKESTLNWFTQPDPVTGATAATAGSGEGYREFDVKAHIQQIFAGTLPNHGWVIRDQSESQADAGDQTFLSRETAQDPPEITLPELELRFEAANEPAPGAPPEPGAPEIVTCGQIITKSTKLAADVTGCLGEGIAIGAPNIVLDLNGHTVSSGLVLEPGEEDGLTPGIRTNYTNVVIRNGTVTNFGYGVLIGPGATYNVVHDMTLVRNALSGLTLFDADNGRIGNTVRDNVFDSNGETGVQLMSGTEGSLIENNTFISNGMSIHLFAARANTIRGNEISGIILDPLLDSDAGIVLENGSRENVLENNDVSDTGDAGVIIHQGSHRNSVTGGVLLRNGDAGVIVGDSDQITVDGVLSHQQSDGGVVVQNSSNSVVKNSDLRYNPSGVDASNTNELLVQNNDVSNSLQAGIGLGNGVNMIVRNNVANSTGGSGISMEGGVFDTSGGAVGGALFEGNTANQNAENGLSIAVAGHTIRDNDAHNNAGFGILAGELDPADPLVANIDGGGNSATGNGEFVNCLGVLCDGDGAVGLLEPDLEPPTTQLLTTPPSETGNETAVFTFTGADNRDPVTALGFECRLDAPPDPALPPEEPDLEPPDPNQPPEPPEPIEGEGWAECVSPTTLLMLEPGSHKLEVRAFDQAGNFDLTPAVYEWEITAGVEEDGTEECGPGETPGTTCTVAGLAPDTKITAAPGELITDVAGTRYDTTNRAATFKFVGSDNRTAGYNLTFECRHYYEQFNDELGPADMPSEALLPFAPCDSPEQYAADLLPDGWAAGDPLPDGVTVHEELDPDLPLESRCPYDGPPVLRCGGHIVEIRSVDLGGNKDTSPASHAWWIHPPPPDTTAPNTEILSGPDKTTVQTSATFTFAGSDNQTPVEEVGFQCRIDGGAWIDCTSPHTVTDLAPHPNHVFQVRALDLAGNVDDVNGNVDNPASPNPLDPTDGVPAAYVWTQGAGPVAKTIFCGQKITQSIIVNNSLGDCLGHGLIVGADGITIDLNGKTIDGKSIGAGILNNGFDSVTIKNGRLQDFDFGVMLNNGTKLNVVEGVTAQLNQEAGFRLGEQTWPEDANLAPSQPVTGFQSGVDGNVLRSNTLVANNRGIWINNGAKDNVAVGNLIGQTAGEGVFIERASRNLIEGNDIDVASKFGVLLEGATDNTVEGNSISEVGTGVLVGATTSGTTGIESTGNLVEGNTISDSGGPALRIHSSSGNRLIDNVGRLSDSYAIELYQADENVVNGNDVSGNKGGITLNGSSGNTFDGNDTSESDSSGIVLESQSFANALLNNTSSNNQGNGIYIGVETPAGQGALVQGNTTNSNNGMGIQASKPSHIFKDNVAMDNDSWGINVGDPSGGRSNVDGGGNVAQGNKGPLGVDLKPQQCYNITCLGGPGGGDQIAPNTSILDGPIQPETSESVAILRFTGSDNLSPVSFQCRFESTLEADWQLCQSPKTYSGLVNDTYTFEVRAIDFSGNVDPTPASYTWSVVLGAFTVSIDSGPDKITTETSASFSFSASQANGTTYQCLQVPGGTDLTGMWATAPACTSPVTYTGLAVGAQEFWVRATNGASTFDTKMYAWTVGPAPVAAAVACGQVLTQSTRLTNDLVDCGGYGLIVGAPGITIDLDGHTIDGMGLDAGILNNGHDDVTITGGLVSQFLYGVQLNPGTARNVVHSLRVEGNAEAGIALSDADQGADGNLIRDNSIVANENGIALYTGTRNAVIRGNDLGANLGEGGILLEFATGNLIEGNQVGMSGGAGIYMVGGGQNTVVGNTVVNSGAYAIVAGQDLLASSENVIQDNTIKGGQGGVMIAGDGNRVLTNSVSGSTGPGVTVEVATNTLVKGNNFGGNASGITVGEATNTTIESNNASGTLGSGIEVGELALDNVVRNNTASGNGGAGIEITESSVLNRGTLVEGNTADANGGDGIYVEGAGHTITGNVTQLNGGWGIYSIGAIDGGGNFAAGNMEPEQCFGVVCELGIVPGAPDTWIVQGPLDVDIATPGIQTNSRNVSVTYLGSDGPNGSPLNELVFECRIDSTNPLAWEDCEYPAEYLNLSPGTHTLDIRAIDQMGQGMADPTPASVTWTYVALPSGVAPEVILDVVPPAETWFLEAIFTFHSNEPDVTFQCQVDSNGWFPCGWEGATFMDQGAFEWALTETEVGLHTFYVRAIDFEGNIGEPTTYQWSLLGVSVVFTDGPGFVPASGGPQGDPATGGPTSSTSAEIFFEANAVGALADAQFWCRFDSLDPMDFFPCESPFRAGPQFALTSAFPDPLLPGTHTLEVFAEVDGMASAAELEPAVYEWEVVDPLDTAPPDTTIERAPVAADLSSTIFEFTGVDDLTPPFLLTFECQVQPGTNPPNGNEWVECFSPFNLLDVYNYGDPQMLLGEKTFYVRAIDIAEPEFADPTQPNLEGNPDPTPASYTWTATADTRGPITTISGGPADGATIGETAVPYTFFALDNATPQLRLDVQCAAFLTLGGIENAVWSSCQSPLALTGLEPGAYTFAVRAVDLAGNIGPPVTRAVTVAAAPVVTFLSGPNGRIDPISGVADGSSGVENSVFTFQSDQAGSTFECSIDGAEFLPCGGTGAPATSAAWVVLSGEHAFAVRATNAQGILGEEAVYEWLVELAPDVTGPNTTITSGPLNGTLDTVATFSFVGTDNRTPAANLSFECALDTTTAWNSCVAPQQFSDLVRGSHTLLVRAVDAAGNFDTTPASYTWIVAPPPISTILSGPGVEVEQTFERTATFTFSADVTPVTFHCWLDGYFNPSLPGDPGQPAPCNPAGETYTGLGIGTHLFAVRAVDQFGNIGAWEDVEFTVMPSEAVILEAPAPNTLSTTATFRFTSEPLDPSATFYCSLDDRPFGLCTDTPVDGQPGVYEKTYTNLWSGAHTFQVQTLYTGLDWMGQPFEHDPTPAVHTWNVDDFTPPDTFIDFGPPATTSSTSAYLQVSSDDPTATIACTLSGPSAQAVDCEPGVVIELTDLLPGAYTLTATAADTAVPPNVDATPAEHSWTIEAPSGPPNTPVGTNVVVPFAGATVTFFSVETAGTTTLDQLSGGPALPEGYGGASTMMFDISTTALYTDPVTVCIEYDVADFGGGTPSVRLLHFDGSEWLDVTTLNDPFSTPARVCSNTVEGFSIFALALASSGMMPEAFIISGPDGPPGPEGLPSTTSGSATFTFWVDQPNAIAQCSIDNQPFFFCEPMTDVVVGPLTAGGHEFIVQAINELGWMDLTPAIYEFEVIGPDVTPPSTSITSPVEPYTTPNFITTFQFSGTDDFTPTIELDYQCTLDGASIGNCEVLEQIEVLTAGVHTLLVQAIDEAGNIDLQGALFTWEVIDMSGPDTEILTGPESETTETTATFTFQGFELIDGPTGPIPVNEFECKIDTGDFGPCPGGVIGEATYTGLAGGAHVFHVRAVDPDGNRDISPEFYEWLIVGPPDTTPPETYITTYPDPANSGPDVTFGFASNEPVETFECSWGSGTPPAAPTTWEDCGAVLMLQALGSGTHWLWARAIDAAIPTPNVDPTPAGQDRGFGPNDTDPFVWTTTGEPNTTIVSGPDDPTGAFSAEFVFTSDQAAATFQCSVNGSPWTPCTSSETEPYVAGPFLPDEGGAPMEHQFEVRAVNQYRNANGEQVMDLSPAVYMWTVQDVTPPEAQFLGALEIGPPQFLDPGLRFTFRGVDDMASSFELEFECAITNTTAGDPVVWESCGEPAAGDSFFHDIVFADYLGAPGTYTFQVRALDLSLNPGAPAPVPAYEFPIEDEPETTFVSVTPAIAGPDFETTATSFTFEFSGTGTSFMCAFDSTTFEACTSPVSYSNVGYGEHLFEVFALAAHGTPDASPAFFEFVSGTNVAPDVTINLATAPPATGGTATSGTIEFSSTDPQASFLCVLDGGTAIPCTSPFPYTNLLAGAQNPHSLEVTATRADLLPSVTLNTALHEWVIADDAAPETTLLPPLPTNPSGNSVTFTFTGSDNGTTTQNLTFECRLDGIDPWVGCSSPAAVPNLTGGQHTFEVRATDQTPLTDLSPANYTWNVIAPPLTTITNQAPAGTPIAEGGISTSATGELSFFDQPGSTYECRLDAVNPDTDPFAACTSPVSYDLANGEHVFEVRATTLPLNGQSLIESPAAEYSWSINAADTTPPNTTIELGPAASTTNTSATFIFSGTDNLTAPAALTFECSLDGAIFADCDSGITYSGLAVGNHTFAVRASDTALPPNVGSPAEHVWTITAPGLDNTPTGTNVEVATGGATLTFDNVLTAGFTSVSTLTAENAPNLPAGYNTAGALYYDVSTTATFTGNVTVCLPSGTLVDAHILHFDGQWVDVTFEAQGVQICGVVSSLSPFAVAEATAAVAPNTSILQAPADPTVQDRADGANIRFQFGSTLPLSSFECRLDAATLWSSCGTPYDFSAGFGEHTLRVRAVSEAGVRDATPEAHTWTVLARPVATIDASPADQDASTPDIENESQTATFEFSSDQVGSTFECRLTGETTGTGWVACTSPQEYTNLGLGEYTFEVQAIKGGNASFIPAQFEWEVADLTPPVVSIVSGPEGSVDQTTAQFVFTSDESATFQCSFGGDIWAACTSGTTYNGFEKGTHTFSVRATDLSEHQNVSDPVSRTWTVADLTAPVLTVSTPPATTSATSMELTFSATDNWPGTITLECRLDGATLQSCVSPKSYSGLSAAQHSFEVKATDSSGNAATIVRTWTVQDVVDPEAEITSMTTGSLIFEFTGTDDHTAPGDLRFECRVDSNAYASCSSPKTYSNADLEAMTPGQHTFQVRAIDQAGNVGQPDSRTFTVADTKAPNTTITGQPTATTTNTTASFTFTGSDDGTPVAGLTYECALDTAAFAACSSPKEYTGLAVGSHTFQVRAKDAANNVDASPASYTWAIQAPAPTPDTTAPETNITANPPATTTETSASFSFAGTDNVTPAASLTFECSLDTGAYAVCTSPRSYTALATGSHTFRVRAKDAANNVDQSPATFTWTIQSNTVNCGTAQTLTANADAWLDQGSSSSNKGSDSILKVMSKSGNGNLRAVVRFALPTKPQGCNVATATLRLYAKSASSGQRTLQAWLLNNTWSEGSVTWANQPGTVGGPATVSSGTGYRDWNVAGHVQAMYDGGNANGFLVRDATENQDAEQQLHAREESSNRPQLVVTFGTGAPPSLPPAPGGGGADTTPPDTTITGSPLAATQSTSASFTFTGSDNVTATGSLTYECQLDVPDTSAWTTCTSPRNLTGLTVGSHIFRVRAKDAAGNVDPQPAVYTWVIDQTAPETVISSGPQASTTSTTATFEFLSPEQGSTFQCSLDSAAFANCASPATYSNLSVAAHTFQVRAIDAAGNIDQTPASYPWTITPGGTPVNCGPTQTLASTADAWIDQSSPGSNKGTDSILKVMSKSGNANLRALLRFNNPSLPAGCKVKEAELRIFAGSASSSQRDLDVYRLTGSWTEGGVTWGNAPDTDGDAATTTSGSGYREWDVKDIVQAMYSTGANNGFLLRDRNEDGDAEQQFFAREKGESPPQLVITFEPA